VPFAIVLAVILAIIVFMVVALVKEPGPTATDVAIGYERAWDTLDFVTLWTLSGIELRDGLTKDAYLAAKRAAYSKQQGLLRLVGDVRVERVAADGRAAEVVTRLHLRDGSDVSNVVRLAHRDGTWCVVGYSLQSSEPTPS
jgi:hypothetical protein